MTVVLTSLNPYNKAGDWLLPDVSLYEKKINCYMFMPRDSREHLLYLIKCEHKSLGLPGQRLTVSGRGFGDLFSTFTSPTKQSRKEKRKGTLSYAKQTKFQ